MGHNDSGAVWGSPREVIPTQAQLELLAQFSAVDHKFFDRSVATGLAVISPSAPRISFARRVARRALRIAPGVTRPAVKARNLARRETRKLVWRFKPYRPAEASVVHGISLRVIDLNVMAPFNEVFGHVEQTHTVIVRPGARLLPGALEQFAAAIAAHPDAQLFYGDSFAPQGFRVYRPAPSTLLLSQVDWLGAAIAVPTSLFLEPSAAHSDTDVNTLIRQIALSIPEERWHLIPVPLGIASLLAEPITTNRLAAPVANPPKVSIIIPTRGTSGEVNGQPRCFVTEAVRSIVKLTTYPNYEIVVVADDPTPQGVIDELEQLLGDRLKLVRWSRPFNFSEKMNLGAAVASGELLLMLNDDIEVATPDWLNEMVALVQRDDVGMVGALLFFEDLSLQHAGHLYRGGAGHIGFGKSFRMRDPNSYFQFDREVSGVTGACALIPAKLLAEVGGFSEVFPGNYNDVDLSLKVRSLGKRIVCSGAARLYHFESKSRDATVRPDDLANIQARWARQLSSDPFWRDPAS